MFVEGRDSPGGSEGRLCVKGRYGHDYVIHPHRLTKPLIRIDYPKGPLSKPGDESDLQKPAPDRGRKAGGRRRLRRR